MRRHSKWTLNAVSIQGDSRTIHMSNQDISQLSETAFKSIYCVVALNFLNKPLFWVRPTDYNVCVLIDQPVDTITGVIYFTRLPYVIMSPPVFLHKPIMCGRVTCVHCKKRHFVPNRYTCIYLNLSDIEAMQVI